MGSIAARYDKMHMFDVQVSDTETYRESASFRPGGAGFGGARHRWPISG
jgi:predicted amidohydrolase